MILFNKVKLTSIIFPILILVLSISLCRVLAFSLLASRLSLLASITALFGLNSLWNFLPVMFPSGDFLQFNVLKSFLPNIIIIVSLTVHTVHMES